MSRLGFGAFLITENPAAAKALTVTKSPLLAATAGNGPDPNQAPDRTASR